MSALLLFSFVERVQPTDPGTPAEHWVSIEDAAALLGVAQDPVLGRVDGKGLPGHEIGNSWKLKLSEVDVSIPARRAYDRPERPLNGARPDRRKRG